MNAQDLSISVQKGEIKLNNIDMKPSAFDKLGMPITIKSGRVGEILIKLSWTKLTSSPIVVTLKNIYVLAGPNTGEKDAAADKMNRRALLEAEMQRHRSELLSDSTSSASDASMAQKIINNMRLIIKDVHVRYEQSELVRNLLALLVQSTITDAQGAARGVSKVPQRLRSGFVLTNSASSRANPLVISVVILDPKPPLFTKWRCRR